MLPQVSLINSYKLERKFLPIILQFVAFVFLHVYVSFIFPFDRITYSNIYKYFYLCDIEKTNLFSKFFALMIRSSLLFIISLVFGVPGKINSHQSVNKDSVAIQHWVKPILDSIFINPKAVLPWLDSLNVYADTTQNAYAKLRASILKGNYYWAINHFDTAIMQYHNSVYWAQRGGYKVNEINAMSNIALVYNTWGNFDSASLYYLEAIEKPISINCTQNISKT